MRVRTLGIAVLLLFVAACSGGEKKPTAGDISETAEATSAPAAGETAAPADASETARAGTAKPSATQRTSSGGGPVAQAPPGTANIPKAGKYVYVSSGTQDSIQPGATPTTYKDRETTVEFLEPKDVDGGKEQKYRAGGEQGTSTTTTRWDKSKVLLMSVSFSAGPQGQIECKFNTPAGGLEVAHFPMKAEKFPRQEWKNDDCEGSHEQEVLKEETLTVQGRSWKTWKIATTTRIKITFQSAGGGPIPAGPQTIETVVQSTQWLAPDLGTEVKSDSVNEFAFGTSKSKGNTTRELKAYP